MGKGDGWEGWMQGFALGGRRVRTMVICVEEGRMEMV